MPTTEKNQFVAMPLRMLALGARTCYLAPPRTGGHGREALIECGVTSARSEALAAAGVVLKHP